MVTRASAWRSTWAKSMIVPTLEVVAPTVEPTVRFGSGRTCVSETTSEGLPLGWMSIRAPMCFPASTYGVIPTTVPSTGE